MKILIDARLYGLENAGLGRYTMNLVQGLIELDKENKYIILLRKKYFNKLRLPDNFQKILVDFRHYSLREQLELPKIIKKQNPDLVHFPHFNVPLFYCGDYVVTIHDIVMHKNWGRQATTLCLPLYLIKRLGYRLVFDLAIKRAKRIIVPSKFVKKELIGFYRLNPNKIEVIYEGVTYA